MIKLVLPLALALSGTAALAQEAAPDATTEAAPAEEGMDHAGMEMGDLMAPMNAMMQSMQGMESTGNPDADFLMMMIPHHQSAIDMARVELEQGQDQATRDMAQTIIDSQEAEIAEMEAMLAAMGHSMP